MSSPCPRLLARRNAIWLPDSLQPSHVEPPFIPGPLPSKYTIVVATIDEKTISETFVPSTLSEFATLTERTTITSTDSFSDPITLIVGKGGVAWVPFSPGPGLVQVPDPTFLPQASGEDGLTNFGAPTHTGFSTGGPHNSNTGPSGPSRPGQTGSGIVVSNTRDPGRSETGQTGQTEPAGGTGGTRPTGGARPTSRSGSADPSGSGSKEPLGASGSAHISTGGPRSASVEPGVPSGTGFFGETLHKTGPPNSDPSGSHPTGSGHTGSESSMTGPSQSDPSGSHDLGRSHTHPFSSHQPSGTSGASGSGAIPSKHTGTDRPASSGSHPGHSTGVAASRQTGSDTPSSNPGASISNGIHHSNVPSSGSQPAKSQPGASHTGSGAPHTGSGAQPGSTHSAPGITHPPSQTTHTGNPGHQTTSRPDIFAAPIGFTVFSQSGGAVTYSKETYSNYAGFLGTTTITTSAVVTDQDGSTHETHFPVIIGPGGVHWEPSCNGILCPGGGIGVESSAAACNMKTLPPAPPVPPTEAPPTSTFLEDFSAPAETNTGTGSYESSMASKTQSSAASSGAACAMKTLPPAPPVPPTEAPPTSTFLEDFSAAAETNTGTGSYGSSIGSRTQSSAASSGAACAIKTLPPAPDSPPTEAPPTSTFLPDFSAAPETNTGTGSYGTMTGTRTAASRTGTQSMSSGAACALKSLPPAPENPPAEAPPTASTDLGIFSAAPETNTGSGFVSATGSAGHQPSKSKDGSSMVTPAPTKTKSNSAPSTTVPPIDRPLSDCKLIETTVALGPQTHCTCANHIMAGLNVKTSESTVYTMCAAEPYPTVASHTIDPPKPTPTVVKPVDPPSAPSCVPPPTGHVQDAHKDRMWSAVQDFCDQFNAVEPYHANGIDQEYTWHDNQLTQIFDDNDSTDDVYEMSIKSVDHCDSGVDDMLFGAV
ncbi:MAG: hypothetical protein Q9220_007574 [cf. Caloplaca sp. 1 TL-2023]